MASIAVATKSETVWASANYITQRLDGALNTRMVSRRIVQLRSHNLLVLRNKHNGEYWVPVPSSAFLEALETRLGVSEARPGTVARHPGAHSARPRCSLHGT